jgi:hypothetical protein
VNAGLRPSEAVHVAVHVGGLRPGDVGRLRRGGVGGLRPGDVDRLLRVAWAACGRGTWTACGGGVGGLRPGDVDRLRRVAWAAFGRGTCTRLWRG